MYESHFGFSGPPFQLSPDPGFYFDSRGHNHALAYLKFGVHQGEGFIVVTGEIGAGKTTLVRTLIDSLQSQDVVAAQVVSTQLESGDLLRSIITAFGIALRGAGKADMIASIEAFLTSLALSGRRALLLVDEAQNLPAAAVEELRMLSNFQLGNRALLQSFLVGQPELRQVLQSDSMEQFRQRVIASCHLGPLEQAETRAYVEHRLQRVGWSGKPSFADESFERIHHHTRGVPRRINLLCNRLLLAAYLGGHDTIDLADVDAVAIDFMREMGGGPTPPSSATAPVLTDEVPATAVAPVARNAWAGHADVVRLRMDSVVSVHKPIVCLVDTPLAYLKALALSESLSEDAGLPPLVLVNPGTQGAVTPGGGLTELLRRASLEVHLGATQGRYAECAAVAQTRFDALVVELSPRAVLVLGEGDTLLACCMVAAKSDIPVLRLEADVTGEAGARGLNSELLDRLVQVFYVGSIPSHYALQRKGVPGDRVRGVGHLLDNVLHLLRPHAVPARNTLQRVGADGLGDTGYAVVTAQYHADAEGSEAQFAAQVKTVCMLSSAVPLVWPVKQHTQLALRNRELQKQLAKARVAVVPQVSYLEVLGLLASAQAAVLGADMHLSGEVQSMNVPAMCIAPVEAITPEMVTGSAIRLVRHPSQALKELQGLLSQERDDEDHGLYWDGGAAQRIASHLKGWLRRHGSSPQAPSAEYSEMVTP
jgi:putative secretion ATPase (PEP-CTERM system associated)